MVNGLSLSLHGVDELALGFLLFNLSVGISNSSSQPFLYEQETVSKD